MALAGQGARVQGTYKYGACKWVGGHARSVKNVPKREPKGDRNASRSRCVEKVAKKSAEGMSRGGYQQMILGAFWEPFSIKNLSKIYAEIETEKVMNFDEKSMRK